MNHNKYINNKWTSILTNVSPTLRPTSFCLFPAYHHPFANLLLLFEMLTEHEYLVNLDYLMPRDEQWSLLLPILLLLKDEFWNPQMKNFKIVLYNNAIDFVWMKLHFVVSFIYKSALIVDMLSSLAFFMNGSIRLSVSRNLSLCIFWLKNAVRLFLAVGTSFNSSHYSLFSHWSILLKSYLIIIAKLF